MESLFYNGEEYINGYSNPNFSIYGILGGAAEFLDPQVLFDSFEKQVLIASDTATMVAGVLNHWRLWSLGVKRRNHETFIRTHPSKDVCNVCVEAHFD